MAERRKRRKTDLAISGNLLISIILMLITGYAAFVIKSLSDKIDKNYNFFVECSTKIDTLQKDIVENGKSIIEHLAWHHGKGDNGKKPQ